MNEHITLDKLSSHLDFCRQMYDAVRLVDPIRKRVLDQRGFEPTNEVCHHYWQDGKLCDNCISIQAHLHNHCYIKLEQSPEAIMLVTAFPVDNAERPLVLELLKNAMDSMLIGNGSYADGRSMPHLVTELNELVTKDELTDLFNRRYVDERLLVDVISHHRFNAIVRDICGHGWTQEHQRQPWTSRGRHRSKEDSGYNPSLHPNGYRLGRPIRRRRVFDLFEQRIA